MTGRFKFPIMDHSIQYLKRKKIKVAKWGTPKKKMLMKLKPDPESEKASDDLSVYFFTSGICEHKNCTQASW